MEINGVLLMFDNMVLVSDACQLVFIAGLPVRHGTVGPGSSHQLRMFTSGTWKCEYVQRRVRVHHISHRLVANDNGYTKTGDKKRETKEDKTKWGY